MSAYKVLYEAKLAREGRGRTCALLVVIVLWLTFWAVVCFRSSWPDDWEHCVICAVSVIFLAAPLPRVMRLVENTGVYRISVDNYGLYVHSDDPASAPSFSVIATDLRCLVHKIIEDSDNPVHEYYVETKSGTRHLIEPFFMFRRLDAMVLFDQITDYFPWVEILDEVSPPSTPRGGKKTAPGR